MRFRTLAAGLLLAVAVTYSATLVIAPDWSYRTGLDVWNHVRTADWARDEEARNRDLDSEVDQQRRRDATCDRIALDVCERRISVRDALGDIASLAADDPYWLAGVRDRFRSAGLSAAASDRAAAAAALRFRIELALARAKKSGDAARAALVAARLTSFDDEIRELCEAETIARANP